jgi:membrane-associated phospholipid phosphatase
MRSEYRTTFLLSDASVITGALTFPGRLTEVTVVRGFEWVSAVYFATLSVAALVRPLPARRRAGIGAGGFLMCGAIVWLASMAGDGFRRLSPLVVILVGYYLSGAFALHPSIRFEHWLLSWDRRLLGDPAVRFVHWPRALLAPLEVLYVGCFLLVPAGLVVLLTAAAASTVVDRYWTMVIAAEFASFISLAFVYARPPWALAQRAALPDRAVHRAAATFVERLTIRANTFPSGHAAGSFAVALGVVGTRPAAGVVLLALAVAISTAAVVGRYHYAIDVIAGIVLALAIFAALG